MPMAIALDMGGRTGGSMPSKKETAELKRYANELKMSAGSWNQQVLGWEKEGEAAANAEIAKAVAKFRASGNSKGLASYLQGAAGKARADAERMEAELDKLKWHLVVDALSIVDPVGVSDGVSIWMDLQD
jgi:hypothetical protein